MNTTENESLEGRRGYKQAKDKMARHLLEHVEVGCDDGEVYISHTSGDGRIHYLRLDDVNFQPWLTKLFFKVTGVMPRRTDVKQMEQLIIATAKFPYMDEWLQSF